MLRIKEKIGEEKFKKIRNLICTLDENDQIKIDILQKKVSSKEGNEEMVN